MNTNAYVLFERLARTKKDRALWLEIVACYATPAAEAFLADHGGERAAAKQRAFTC